MCDVCKRMDKTFETAQEGDLRVWWVPQIPMKGFFFPVDSIAEAKHMLEMLADYDLFQWQHRVKPDYSNVGGLQVYESDGEGGFGWNDWCNEYGDGIDDVDENGKTLED